MIEDTDLRSARENFRTSVLPRNLIAESNVFESFPGEDGVENRRRDDIKHDHPERGQKNKIKEIDQTVSTLMKMFETLKQKNSDCKKDKVPKVQSSPKFTWVESQKLKPNIARNLALFGKPFDIEVPRHPPKLPVIKIWNPLSSKTRSSWKPVVEASNWME